jgi:Tol biopolymer transport system component
LSLVAWVAPDPRPRRRRWLLAIPVLIVVWIGLAAIAWPFVRLGLTVAHDAMFRLDDTPAPYASLPPPGPALADGDVVFDSDRTGNFEIYAMRPDGSGVRQVTSAPEYDSWWARLSPDRRFILFYRTPAGVHDRDPSKNSLWVTTTDGRSMIEVRPRGTDGWRIQGHAEWSPDGTELVMAGGSRLAPQIYVTTNTGRNPRNVTRRNGLHIDPSFSPDGRTIYFVRCPGGWLCTPSRYEIYAIDAARLGEPRRLTHDDMSDYDPYASPDGSQLAWLTHTSNKGSRGAWNIRIMTSNGERIRRLTDDDNVNSKPAWSRDGHEIYFHRLERDEDDFDIFVIDAAGGRMRRLTNSPGVHEYPGT